MKDGEPPGVQVSTVECRGWGGRGRGGENSLHFYLLYLCPW